MRLEKCVVPADVAGYDVTENGSPVLNQTRANNKANEITEIETPPEQTQWAEPEYDARGNMITVPKPNSPASAFTCTWDAWDRLIQVKDGESVVATYAYDGLNHRITKTVGETIRHAYYNTAWQLLETRETTDPEAAPEDLDPKEQYIWSVRYIDAPVLRDRDTDDDGDLDETLYFCNDANMNVTALVEPDGDVVERYAYTPYGKPSFFDASWNPRAESAYDNAILYCGYYYDKETGLYHVRYRYYHPFLGLLLSRDPIGYRAGTNLYGYVRSSPCVHVDPYGVLEARSQPNGPCIRACYATWYGLWLKPSEYYEGISGYAVVREKLSLTVKDCDGKLLRSENQVMFYYLAGYTREGMIPERGYFNRKTGEFHYQMGTRHSVVGPGGKFRGDCTEGVIAVEADVRFSGWVTVEPKHVEPPFGDPVPSPSQGGYWPQRVAYKRTETPPEDPKEYKDEKAKWPFDMTDEGLYEKFTASLKYQWRCCGEGDEFHQLDFEPSGLEEGPSRRNPKYESEAEEWRNTVKWDTSGKRVTGKPGPTRGELESKR
jgi:RHS repeat-associated protein